jgi:hypothetical protein
VDRGAGLPAVGGGAEMTKKARRQLHWNQAGAEWVHKQKLMRQIRRNIDERAQNLFFQSAYDGSFWSCTASGRDDQSVGAYALRSRVRRTEY